MSWSDEAWFARIEGSLQIFQTVFWRLKISIPRIQQKRFNVKIFDGFVWKKPVLKNTREKQNYFLEK